MKKIFIGIIFAIVLIGFGLWLYFVSQFSAVYPPIEKYKIQMTQNDLRAFIDSNKIDTSDFKLIITDSTGTKESGFNYYVDCNIKNLGFENQFKFKYYKNRTNGNITVDLIGVFNISSNTGGYKKEDKGVAELQKVFEQRFIVRLKHE